MMEFFCDKSSIMVFDRILNAPLVFCRTAILNHLCWKYFCIKVAGFVSANLLWKLITDDYYEFSEIFENSYFSRFCMTASDFNRYYCDVCAFLVQLLLKSTFTSQIFAHVCWCFDENHMAWSKYFDSKMMLSHKTNLTKISENVLEDVSIWLNLS